MTEKKPTIFARNRAKRNANIKPYGDVRLTDDQKCTILEMVSEGALLGELIERGVLPAQFYLWNEQRHDAAFAAKYEEAQTKGAQAILVAAQEHALEMLESGDPDQMRAADAFMRITETFVEKIAPKKFGQLVKLGADPDAPLTLQVINYAVPLVAAQSLDVIDAEYRAIATGESAPRARDGQTVRNDESGQACDEGAGTGASDGVTPTPDG